MIHLIQLQRMVPHQLGDHPYAARPMFRYLRRSGLPLVIGAGSLIGGALPAGAQGPAAGQVIGAGGHSTVQRLDAAQPVPALRRMPLHPGDTLRTASDGWLQLLMNNGFPSALGRDTVAQLLPPSGRLVYIRKGRWQGRISHESVPRVPQAQIFPHGTELEIEVADDGSTTLTVVEGEAVLQNDHGQVTVREGMQSTARPDQAPTTPVAANVPLILQWTNDLQPVALLLETSYVSQDPAALAAALREAQALPAGPERWRRLGDVQHDLGHLEQALAAYQESERALGPGTGASERAALSARIGQSWLELGKLPDAEARFREALRLLGRERAHAERRTSFEATLANLEGASLGGHSLSWAASQPEPRAERVEVAARVGLVMVLASRRENDAALAEAEAAVAADGGSPLAHTARALALIRLGRRDEAEQALDQALRLNAGYAAAYAWRSFLRRAAERLDAASADARQAVALAPYSSLARQALSDAAFALGRLPEARQEAKRAVALNFLSPGAHVSLGRALLQAGQLEAAAREASQAVALDPDLDRAHFLLGVVLAEARRYGRATAELEQAVKLDPGYLEAQAFLARVYLQQDRRAEAEAVATAVLAREPRFAPARAALGQAYHAAGRLREAAEQYQEAVKLQPGSPLYHLGLARVYLDQNDLPDALAQALAAVSEAPGASETHAELGLVYDRQDNQEQAVREYREAISLSPENSLARLGLVTGFTPHSRDVGGSGRDQGRERAQALLRDPAVLQETFKPGVTTELLGGGGGDSHEEQRLLHRGQFDLGQVHDLSLATRFSDGGYRPNSWTDHRLLQTDIAVQATGDSQVLFQYAQEKNGGGLPESRQNPNLHASLSRRQAVYNLAARQYLGAGTHLWLRYGIRPVRVARDNPDGLPPPIPPEMMIPRGFSLYSIGERSDERSAELRLDHQMGRHVLTYGLGHFWLNAVSSDLKFRRAGDPPQSVAESTLALEVRDVSFLRDLLQYLQDDFRIGDRMTAIVGTQYLRTTDRREVRQLVLRPQTNPRPRATEHTFLPYLALTYRLNPPNLIRLIGNKSLLRPAASQLASSEAFIVGEPISTFFTVGDTQGRAETYELDFEHRLSPRTFSKLFLEYSQVRDYLIAPTLDQQVFPFGFTFPKAHAQIIGARLEHQISRYLSGFTRWSYWRVEDRSAIAHGVGADPNNPVPNPSRGLQVPFVPRGQGLMGLNYVDRAGSKLLLQATLLSRRYTDISITEPGFASPSFNRRSKRSAIGPTVQIDLRIAKEPSVRMEYGLTVSNLFNTVYRDVWPGFPIRGRTWLATLAVRF